ncbi:MAG TPA: FAD binding domain-containing protein [Candidatus Limnocylindrales bacterium]
MTIANYYRPESVTEALDILAARGADLLVIAGGTIAMPLINEGISLPAEVMGLRRAGLDTFARHGDEVIIGATLPITRLVAQTDVPLLRAAALRTASWSVRNMATVGGNLFAPPPAGDVATALLALGARATITGRAGTREVALDDFWTGFMTTVVAPDELLTSITVPVTSAATSFIKFGRKRDNTPAVVTVAVTANLDTGIVGGARIALGAAGAHAIRAHNAEAALNDRPLSASVIAAAADAAAAECEPFTDAVASDAYRRQMVRLFVARALSQLGASVQGREA